MDLLNLTKATRLTRNKQKVNSEMVRKEELYDYQASTRAFQESDSEQQS